MKKIIFTLLFSAICGLGSYAQIGTTASISIAQTPQYVCAGSQFTLTATLHNITPVAGAMYSWYLNTSPIHTSLQMSTSNVLNYTLTSSTIIYVQYNNGTIGYINVTVYPKPIPTIIGEQTVCTTGIPITYTLSNYFSYFGVNYTFTAPGSSNISLVNPSTGTFTVTWANGTTSSTITAYATNSITGCVGTYSLPISTCCHPTGIISYDNPTSLSNFPLGNYTGLKIAVNGTFTINSLWLQFNDCEIWMGAGAKIVVNTGNFLDFQNCHIHACNEMWDGIYVSDPSSIAKFDGGIFEDAINGIVSTNGGNWGATGTIFNKNYKSLSIRGVFASQPWGISSSVFTCRDFSALYASTNVVATRIVTLNNAYLANPVHTSATGSFTYNGFVFNTTTLNPPYTNKRSYEGIEFNSTIMSGTTDGIIVGLNSALPTNYLYATIFDYLDYGVRMTQSNVNVSHCLFENIQNTGSHGLITNGTAIYANNDKRVPQFYLMVGRDPLGTAYANTFKYCTSAIDSYYYNNDIENNTISNNNLTTTQTGINLFEFYSFNQTVYNNTLTNVTSGIQLNQTAGTSGIGVASVTSNTITCTSTAPTSGSASGVQGIYVSEAMPMANSMTIQSNEINDPAYGIWLRRTNNIQVLDNSVYFHSPSYTTSPPYYGIKLENAVSASITSNHIENTTGTPTAITAPAIKGISIETADHTTVTLNKMIKMGIGIYGFSACPGSSFTCNTNDACFNGFNFSNATIGQQGALNASSYNKWQNIPNGSLYQRYITGSFLGSPFIWYCNPGTPFYDVTTPTGNTFTFGPVTYTNTSTANSTCAPPAFASQAAYREAMLGEILRNEIVYDTLSNEFKLKDSIYAYKELSNDTNLLHLGTFEDALYQALYDTLKKSNIGKFQEVIKYMRDSVYNDTLAAKIVNQNIPTTCSMDENQQLVNSIYLNELNNQYDSDGMPNVNRYDSTEIMQLENIAYQNPMKGGDAVYMARVMLFIDVIDDGYNGGKRFTSKKPPVPALTSYKMYPNPNNGTMQLSYSLNDNETGYVEIYNIMGEKINEYKLLSGTSLLNIREPQLENGVYFYQVYKNDNKVYSGKIVISK